MLVSKYLKQQSLHRSWNPERPEVAKLIFVETIVRFPTRPPRKLHLCILVSSSESTFHTTTEHLHFQISGFIPCFGLNISIKISIENFFLSKMRFFFKINCFMLNLSFLFHLDEKFNTATAPVFYLFVKIFSTYAVSTNF